MRIKKDITFFLSSLSGGGTENVCVNLANSLIESGWDVSLVVLNLKNADFIDKLSSCRLWYNDDSVFPQYPDKAKFNPRTP